MEVSCRLIPLMLLLHNSAPLSFYSLKVTCDVQNICAVMGDEETLSCSYSNIDFKTGFWFSEKQSETWRKKDEPEDLILDSDYSGRVNQRITDSQSQLTIRDLTERDSGEYQLMFIMKDGAKHLGSVSINLTVTELRVTVHPSPTDQRVRLTCDTSCNVTSMTNFHWTKNRNIDLSQAENLTESTASYSCSLTKNSKNPSTPVCFFNTSCWNVIYNSTRVCALVGSTVDIPSKYSHPTGHTVEKTLWHLPYSALGEYTDLLEQPMFRCRVEYVGSTLRIKDVKMSDSGEYRFRIITNVSTGKFSGAPGVTLTVTDTQVKTSPTKVSDGEKVILSCLTKCTLGNKYTYIWYKNGTQVTGGFTLLNKLYLDSVSSEEIQQYSCDVTEPMESSASDSFDVFPIVFVVQGLIIGTMWMWFVFKKNVLV